MKFSFNYYLAEERTQLESELYFTEIEGVSVAGIDRGAILDVFGLHRNKVTELPSFLLAVEGKFHGRKGVMWTLETVGIFLERLIQVRRLSFFTPALQNVVKHFQGNFLIYLNNLLNPQIRPDIQDILPSRPMWGEAAIRADFSQAGDAPAYINYMLNTLNAGIPIEVVGEAPPIEFIEGFSKPLTPTQLEARKAVRFVKQEQMLSVDDYKSGDRKRRGIVTMGEFSLLNPSHKAAQRPDDQLSRYDQFETDKPGIFRVVKNAVLRKETRPWDNQPRFGNIF